MFAPNIPMEPRMKGPHAISLFKLVAEPNKEKINPMAVIMTWQNSLMFVELEKTGKLKETLAQLQHQEAVELEQYERLRKAKV